MGPARRHADRDRRGAHVTLPGRIRTVVTALEMTARPARAPHPAPPGRLALLRAEPPTVAFYRFLYDTIGARWLWIVRRRMSDDDLRAIISDPEVEVFVLHVAGCPAGYVELDFRTPGDVEIAYLGVMPEFVGRGFGRHLLEWAIDTAWSRAGTTRLWIHTCSWDDPRALAMYQRAGFTPFRQDEAWDDDPRLDGTLPRDYRHPALAPLDPLALTSPAG
ncbi:MAG: GNAT family N-acetyltransferase [Alphaproteobacteria bacterium]|nr:GNAT family N-acetyltransferase [Alphaproteobacteria bacterium]